MKRLTSFLMLLLILPGCQEQGQAADSAGETAPSVEQAEYSVSPDQPTDVVFICQHGYAKSLVSSLYFERMAEERGLSIRAIARGVTPSDEVPEPLAMALREDGFDIGGFQPSAAASDDINTADYIVSFGNEVPNNPNASTLDWSDVSALSENFPQARDEIVAHISALLDEIKTSAPR